MSAGFVTPGKLILVGRVPLSGDELARLRAGADEGARIIGWHHPPLAQDRFPSPDIEGWLRERGIPSTNLTRRLGEKLSNDIEDAVIAWFKSLGREPLNAEGSFRSLFRYRGLSLWWWAELFLYHETPLRLYVRDIEAWERLREIEKPGQVEVIGPERELAALVSASETVGRPGPPPRPSRRTATFSLSMLVKMWGTALKALLRGKRFSGERARFLFLTHASMWRSSELREVYFHPLMQALRERREPFRAVAVGPSVSFPRRSRRIALAEALELRGAGHRLPYVPVREYFRAGLAGPLTRAHWRAWRSWRRFRRMPGAAELLKCRGVSLVSPGMAAFRDTFLLQVPWAIRSYHEMLEVLRVESPRVLLLYAESSGLGRAAIAAARQLGVATFAVQHGIMYPRYFAYEHAADEVDALADGRGGCPLPTRTAVFGELARDLLVERGHYPPASIAVTGSPKFDALVDAARHFDREGTRQRLGVEAGGTLLVVASRFSAIGPVFRDLVRAVEAQSRAWLLVKPHQAERPEPYQAVLDEEQAGRARVVGADENLIELLYASDGLVTVDSLASSEALVLGRPVLVVNLPSHLEPLVEQGVALGAGAGEEIARQLGRFLHDPRLRAELAERRREYLQRFAAGADGRSTERLLQALEETATAVAGEPQASRFAPASENRGSG